MNSKDNTNSANITSSTREAFAGCTYGAGSVITGLAAKSLLFLSALLFSFPVLAIDICHLSRNDQGAVVENLILGMKAKGQREEGNKLMQLFPKKGCSALKPYKMSQLTRLSYFEDLDDYPLSKANDLFKQFPAIEFIRIKVLTQKIPENLFRGLPNLKEVIMVGVIERLPTRLFEQNSNLGKLHIDSDEFIGFSNSQFFRYIPSLKDLAVMAPSILSDLPFLELPEDFCDVNVTPSLVHFRGGMRVKHVPASCEGYAWFSYGLNVPEPQEEYTPVDRCIKGKTCGIRN